MNKVVTRKSEKFLEEYLNNPSPTGFESEGQKMWLSYIKPYIDTHFIDTYGTVVGIINPEEKYNNTRNNIGKNWVEKISKDHDLSLLKK